MKKHIILLLMSLLAFTEAGAQYYDTGQDPASLRWEQIRTPHFRIIYPGDFSGSTGKYARLLEQSYNRLSVLYPGTQTRIPVIIHSHSMQSNGYVSWAPRRMELFPLPGQDNLPMLPEVQLTVHETTHLLQLSSLYQKGAGKLLRYLVGEQAVGLSALEIPIWAFEGDAVYAETATGLSGRGRSNAFTQTARALTISRKGIYNYDKMLAGSYRNFTPDHYVFGYLMMNHLRTLDKEAWGKVIDRVSSGYPFNPVNKSLREETGLTKKRLYDSAFASLGRRWTEEEPPGCIDYPALSVRKSRDYVNHFLPYATGEGGIVSLRTSLTVPSRFVVTDTLKGTEKVLTTTGYIYPYIFSYADSTLIWAEQYPDIRWENRDYSVIKKLDLHGGRVTQLTRRTRYAAPDLSPDGKTVVAVSTTSGLRCSLVFLDASTGEVLMDVIPPDNLILQRPSWSSDGREVTVVTLTDKGEGIRSYRPTGKRWKVYVPESITDIIQAELVNDTLFYLAQGDGSDNIYRLTGDTLLTRVTGSRFGISGFSVTGNKILFSDYSPDGFVIASAGKGTSAGTADGGMYGTIPDPAAMPQEVKDDDQSGSMNFDPVPYRKIAHLFNFHSWFPFYGDIDEIKADPTAIRPGVTLMSQNHLSTLIATAGYEYSGGNHYLHSAIKWSGWHPVIEAEVTWGGNQVVSTDTVTRPLPEDLGRNLQVNVSVYDQLWFARGKFRQLLMPALYINYSNRFTYIYDINSYDRDLFNLTGRLYFSNTFRTAYRDINPRWGQVIDVRLTAAPWDSDLYGTRRYARSIFFFPGVAANHSLVLKAGYENQSPTSNLIYRNTITWPRGFNKDMISEKLLSLSADYTMPLFYPDLTAGSLLYLKRIRGSLYYDQSRSFGTFDYDNHSYINGLSVFSSTGAELLADFYVLRFPFEISAGAGAGYVIGEQRFFVNAVFSVNIYGTVLGRER
jgi:hypothetical protein